MKLINNLFEQLSQLQTETGWVATIQINPEHLVYLGHFPGYPVTPGVVQLQIVQELLENHTGNKLRLFTMSQCKFLTILNPKITPRITIRVEYTILKDLLTCKAWITHDHQTFFSGNSTFRILQ